MCRVCGAVDCQLGRGGPASLGKLLRWLVGFTLALTVAGAGKGGEAVSGQKLRTTIRRHRPKAPVVAPGSPAVATHLHNIPYQGYVATFSVGTPPAPFTMLMDTGSANLFLGGPGCNGCATPVFAPAASRSYVAKGTFDMFDWCSGKLGRDTFLVDGHSKAIRNQSFGVCASSDILAPPVSGSPWYNGLFGLGMRPLETDSAHVVPPLTLMVRQGIIDKALFAIYLDHTDEGLGEIHWGFADPDAYVGRLSWFPMAPEGEDAGFNARKYVYYKVDVTSISLGGTVVESDGQIMTDTGAVGIYPPTTAILRELHRLAPVAPDCSNRATLPPLTLTIGNASYTLPASVYVLDADATDPTAKPGQRCISAFMKGYDAYWLMGDPFFRAVYAVLDVDNHRYGMARNVHI